MEHHETPITEHEYAEHQEALPIKSKDKFLPIAILIAAVVIGGSVVFAAMHSNGLSNASGQVQAAVGTTPTAQTQATVPPIGSRDAVLGSANAPVTLIEYGDYQCPFCGEFFSQTQPQIVANYVNTGKVKMVFRNFAFLGAESTAAANAAECAEDQNKSWAYHDALYAGKVADDAKGGSEDDGFFSTAELLKLGQQVGLDITKFTSCVQNQSDANIVEQDKANATALGVNSTPTVYINGQQIQGAQPYSVFKAAIDAALQKS